MDRSADQWISERISVAKAPVVIPFFSISSRSSNVAAQPAKRQSYEHLGSPYSPPIVIVAVRDPKPLSKKRAGRVALRFYLAT